MEDVQQAHAHERHHHWAELPHAPAQLRQVGPHVHDGRRDLPLGIAVWSPRPRSAKAAMNAEQAEEERHQHWAQVPHKAAQVRPLGPHLHDEGCEQHPLGRQTPPHRARDPGSTTACHAATNDRTTATARASRKGMHPTPVADQAQAIKPQSRRNRPDCRRDPLSRVSAAHRCTPQQQRATAVRTVHARPKQQI